LPFLAVPAQLVRREVPLALAASAAFAFALQGGLSRVEGVLLAVALVACLALLLRWVLANRRDVGADMIAQETDGLLAQGPRTVPGLVWQAAAGPLGTLAGAQLLVWGAVGVAAALQLSEGFVGFSIVAVGTSLPELVTAVLASRRGQSHLLIGIAMESNVFDALGVGGLIALIRARARGRGELAAGVAGVSIMIGVSVQSLAFMARGLRVVRWEAVMLLTVFVGCLPLLAGG
jgi:cation:H+ antiporter